MRAKRLASGLMLLIAMSAAPASPAAARKQSSVAMPALGGIAPPAGTRLLNMDIPGAGGARPAVYELSSPIAPAAFEHLYTASAVRAGYRVSAGKGRVVGVRGDGAGFRLLLSASGGATAGVLTIKPASTRRA